MNEQIKFLSKRASKTGTKPLEVLYEYQTIIRGYPAVVRRYEEYKYTSDPYVFYPDNSAACTVKDADRLALYDALQGLRDALAPLPFERELQGIAPKTQAKKEGE